MYSIGKVKFRYCDLGGIHIPAGILDVALDLGSISLQGVENVSWRTHGDDVRGGCIVQRDGIFLNGFSEGVV